MQILQEWKMQQNYDNQRMQLFKCCQEVHKNIRQDITYLIWFTKNVPNWNVLKIFQISHS